MSRGTRRITILTLTMRFT